MFFAYFLILILSFDHAVKMTLLKNARIN